MNEGIIEGQKIRMDCDIRHKKLENLDDGFTMGD